MSATVESAAVAACAFIALYAGHQIGDHVIQPGAAVSGKGCPGDDRLADGARPWTGWVACLRHVASYTAVQAVALLLIAVVAPMTVRRSGGGVDGQRRHPRGHRPPVGWYGPSSGRSGARTGRTRRT